MEESSISGNISRQMEDIECMTTGRTTLWHNKQNDTFLYDLLARETHGYFVEDAGCDNCMDTEDDCSYAGSSEDFLCNEKAEDEYEEPSEEPKVDDDDDDVFESGVGDRKCQRKGTLKVFEYLVVYICVV